MVRQTVTITNPTGLHLRPAGVFCNTAAGFRCKITFVHDTTTANAKSVLSVLGACIKQGDTLDIICEGEEEEKALLAMVTAVESGLGML
jgi:phosphocarrier protein